MKMIGQTTHQLTITHRPHLLTRLLSTLFVTGAGIGLLLWSGPAKLDCRRSQLEQVTCRFSTPGWLGLAVWRERPIRDLRGVALNRNLDDEGALFYQVMLHTSDGDVPLRPYQTSGLDNTRQTVEQIETFLKSPSAKRLSVSQVDWLQWFGFAPGALFLLVGLRSLSVILFSLRARAIESYRFDQTQGQIIYEYGGLLRQNRQQYAFSEIQRLVLDLDQSAKAWLFLELRSGEVYCLNRPLDKVNKRSGSKWQELQPLADDLSRLIYRPWQLAIGFKAQWLQAQFAQHKQATRTAKFLGVSLEPPSVWCFDRATRTVSYQDKRTIATYKLQEIAEVYITPPGAPLETKDSDGDKVYEINYQVSLRLATGEEHFIQKFSSYHYKWKPDSVKTTVAQEQADAMAQKIRQYIADRSVSG